MAAVDIGQGSNTILTPNRSAMRSAFRRTFALVAGRHRLDADAGKTSASRQTSVSGVPSSAPALDLAGRSCAGKYRAGRPSELECAKLTVARWRECAGWEIWQRRHSDRRGHLRSADHAARCRWPGRALLHLCFCRPMGTVEVDIEARHLEKKQKGAAPRGRPRCRPRDQSTLSGQIQGGSAQGLVLALMEE